MCDEEDEVYIGSLSLVQTVKQGAHRVFEIANAFSSDGWDSQTESRLTRRTGYLWLWIVGYGVDILGCLFKSDSGIRKVVGS